jgi:hypothetical protein
MYPQDFGCWQASQLLFYLAAANLGIFAAEICVWAVCTGPPQFDCAFFYPAIMRYNL